MRFVRKLLLSDDTQKIFISIMLGYFTYVILDTLTFWITSQYIPIQYETSLLIRYMEGNILEVFVFKMLVVTLFFSSYYILDMKKSIIKYIISVPFIMGMIGTICNLISLHNYLG